MKNIKRNLSKERAIAIAEKRKEQTELAKKLMYTILGATGTYVWK